MPAAPVWYDRYDMDSITKNPFASKTIWTLAFQLVASVLVASGTLRAEQAETLTGLGPEVMVGLAGAIFAAVAAYGRVTAKGPIGRKQKPKTEEKKE